MLSTDDLTSEVRDSVETFVSVVSESQAWNEEESSNFRDYILSMSIAYLMGEVEIEEINIYPTFDEVFH